MLKGEIDLKVLAGVSNSILHFVNPFWSKLLGKAPEIKSGPKAVKLTLIMDYSLSHRVL